MNILARSYNLANVAKKGEQFSENLQNIYYTFGKENEILKVNIKINKPGFTLDVVNKGSIGLAES